MKTAFAARDEAGVAFLRLFLLVVCLLAICPLSAFAASAADASQPWQLQSEREGIKVYVRPARAGSPLKAFRGVTTLSVRDWYSIVAAVNDYANVPRWLYFVNSVQEIGRRGPLERDLIFQSDLPWPVNNREAVVTARSWNPPGTWDTVIHFVNSPTLLPPNGDYVRFPELSARFDFHWLGGNRVEVTYELVVDPGGYIPEWLANVVLSDAPYFTLKRFAKAVNQPEYQGRHYDYVVVPPSYAGAR